MDTIKIKDEISLYIEHADDRFLQLVYAMIKADQNTVIGRQVDGTPISKSELSKRAEKSENDIKEGKVQDLIEVRKEVNDW